ncbi:hypothetical protein AAMO2058_000849800 [Amorphochlora amoebiformis]
MDHLTRWWQSFKTRAFHVKSELKKDSEMGNEDLFRSLGALDLVLMGVGGSIGAGIFVLTGIAARTAGPGVVISFAIAAVACIFNALCYAELASRFAVSGSAYLYAILAYGELPALAVGINLLVDYHVGAAAISRSMSVYFVKMLNGWGIGVPKEIGDYQVNDIISLSALAPVFLMLITLVLIRGVKESKWTNFALTSTKILIVLLIVFGGLTKVQTSNWTNFVPKGPSSIFSATSTVFFSYIGFDVVANAAEEAHNPKRNLPIGIVASLVICALLYCSTTLVITGLTPYENISKSAPLSDAMTTAGLKWGQQVINIGATVGLGTTLLTGMYAQSRLYLSIARDGLLPEQLGYVSERSHVPVIAQVWCGVIAAALATPFDVENLAKILSIGIMSAYSVVCISILSFRTSNNRSLLWWVFGFGILMLGTSIAVKLSAAFYISVPLLVLALLTWIPIFTRFSFDVASSSSYLCPLVPLTPLIGLGSNIFMAVQLHWAAWARLLVVCVLVVGVYAGRAWKLRNDMLEIDEAMDSLVGDEAKKRVINLEAEKGHKIEAKEILDFSHEIPGERDDSSGLIHGSGPSGKRRSFV